MPPIPRNWWPKEVDNNLNLKFNSQSKFRLPRSTQRVDARTATHTVGFVLHAGRAIHRARLRTGEQPRNRIAGQIKVDKVEQVENIDARLDW